MGIQGNALVEQAELEAKAMGIKTAQEILLLEQEQNSRIQIQKKTDELEIKKQREMAQIEIQKFTEIITAIGKETLVAISQSGPKMRAEMLKGLNLQGFLVTDGKNPINLFNTANGMLG